MALKISLSEFSQQKLIENIEQPWFQELLQILRNIGSFAEKSFPDKRPLTEMEYQAINGSFRQGCLTTVETISLLALPPKKKAPNEPSPWGELKPEPQNPKIYTQPDPQSTT